jgi:hypothetical protein
VAKNQQLLNLMKKGMGTMQSLPKIFIAGILLSSSAAIAAEKIMVSGGYFSINANAGDQSSSIANPSAFHVGVRKTITDSLEFKVGYSLLMADFSGSDLGYGVDVGINYYPISDAADEKFQDEQINVKTYEIWRPFVGVGFNQRNFQSVRNSYAGMGINFGTEKYHNEKMNWVGEFKYTSLGGSSESTATELQLMFGVVFKL